MSDDARQRFLGELVTALGADWVASYDVVAPYDVLGVTLRCGGADGYVQVVPSSVTGNVVSWRPFPSGTPHYDINTDRGEHFRTCVLASALERLSAWRGSHAPVARTAPVPMLVTIESPQPARLEDGIDAAQFPLTDEGEHVLALARESIDPAAIDRAFPREDDGRVSLSTHALLVELPSTARLARDRGVFLAVQSPRTRKAGNVLTLAIVDAIGRNCAHDWTAARWLWERNAEPPTRDARATECVTLLDAGRFDDALAMFGIALSPSTIKVLEGVPINLHDAPLAPAWQAALRRALWEMAPWSLANARSGSLALLPHQRHQRKAWLAWSGSTIDVKYTGSNARSPDVAWKRDVKPPKR